MYEENSEIQINAKYRKLTFTILKHLLHPKGVGIARGRGRVMGWVVGDGMRMSGEVLLLLF